MDLDDDLNSPLHPPRSMRCCPFTFDSESPNQSDCSSIVHKIPYFVIDLDNGTIVNQRNRLKASPEKMTKEGLTNEFLADLVSMSKSASYLTTQGQITSIMRCCQRISLQQMSFGISMSSMNDKKQWILLNMLLNFKEKMFVAAVKAKLLPRSSTTRRGRGKLLIITKLR